MTTQHGTPIDGHIGIDELADSAEGLLSEGRDADIAAHLARCQQCQQDADALAGVHDLLRQEPAETMPDDVFARLQHTVSAEQQRRAGAPTRPDSRSGSGDGGSPIAGARFNKQHLAEHFTDTFAGRRGVRARFAGGAVAATLLAGAVGFGGYVASASAGTDEPPADRPIIVDDSALKSSATRAVRQGDLDAHHFSRAWRCAKQVTDGDISGIRASVVDGKAGYLVFLPDTDTTTVVFVTGCDSDTPAAASTVRIEKN